MLCFALLCRNLIPSLQVNDSICVEFYYHMWGYHMGSLEIYVKQTDQYVMQWSVDGDQGNVWLERRLTIRDMQPDDQVSGQPNSITRGPSAGE